MKISVPYSLKKTVLLIQIGTTSLLNFVTGQDKLNNQVHPSILPFPASSVTMSPSWVHQRELLNTAYLLSLDPDQLIHNFRINAGLPSTATPLGGWESPDIGLRGHFTGHYLSAVATLVLRYQDTTLKRRLAYMVDALYECQQAMGNGYLSAFPESFFDTLEKKYGGVWAPYYTWHKVMQGLLDVYTCTGNQKSYRMVCDMAAYVSKRLRLLSPETIEKMLYTPQANPSNEAGAMNEVFYNLFEVSRNPEHLDLARVFDREWFLGPLSRNKNILSGLHSNTHLVLVNGFAKGYILTGRKPYFLAAKNFWEMLILHHAYANGSSSGPRPNVVSSTSLSAEHWGVPGHLSNTMTKEIAESCVSHNTQKLTSMLFCLSGNARYADMYMNTFYNSIMALQNDQTGTVVYHLPLGSPQKKQFLKPDDFRCCNGTSIEAFAALNTGIYYHSDTALWVNMYIPSQVYWKEKLFTLKQEGNFPSDSAVVFTVKSANRSALAINMLIPSWANKAEVYINGHKQRAAIKPGSYLSLRRVWNDNDNVRIVFHYNFYMKSMPDDENVFAIFYGPTLLAAETHDEWVLKGTKQAILNNLVKINNQLFQLRQGDQPLVLRPLFAINQQSYGVYAMLRGY